MIGGLALAVTPFALLMRWPRLTQWLVLGTLLLGSAVVLALLVGTG